MHWPSPFSTTLDALSMGNDDIRGNRGLGCCEDSCCSLALTLSPESLFLSEAEGTYAGICKQPLTKGYVCVGRQNNTPSCHCSAKLPPVVQPFAAAQLLPRRGAFFIAQQALAELGEPLTSIVPSRKSLNSSTFNVSGVYNFVYT